MFRKPGPIFETTLYGVARASLGQIKQDAAIQCRIPKNRALLVQIIQGCAAAGIVLALVLSLLLHPDPRGFGTHEQLFLYPCNFYALTGLPCPSCGMTTAFAHMARGHITDAFMAQPAGAIGFIACLAALPCLVFAVVRGKNFLLIAARIPWKYALWALGIMFLSAWLFKILVFLRL